MERDQKGNYNVTPKAQRLFQGKLLERIFSELEAGRTGRHTGDIVGEGAVETQRTKEYEFGDSLANLDLTTSLTNALIRDPGARPIRFKSEDLVVHKTRNTPKCATAVLMDMSGSMRYGGLYINVKKMALALEGVIRRDYPGDFLRFIDMATFAKPVPNGDVASLLPKPVTIFDPVVRLKADMSDPEISESQIPPHFTNIQHALRTSRRFLSNVDTPNKQNHPDHRRAADGALRRVDAVHALPAAPANRASDAPRRAAMQARRDHDQHLLAAKLVAVVRRHPFRLQTGRIDDRPRLLHRRQGSGPVRRVGLCATP
ncbi:MAG: hypothetical protein QM811_30980 [Pirellulales bacterium]